METFVEYLGVLFGLVERAMQITVLVWLIRHW
jgi:hypothetical protein